MWNTLSKQVGPVVCSIYFNAILQCYNHANEMSAEYSAVKTGSSHL